jgi:dipeptidyl aminopeptidase/acylaminoacyl peptidase
MGAGGDADRAERYVVDADGRDRRRLTHDHLYEDDPGWSSDGRRLAYIRSAVRGDTADTDLFVADSVGASRRLLWSPAPASGADRGWGGAEHTTHSAMESGKRTAISGPITESLL